MKYGKKKRIQLNFSCFYSFFLRTTVLTYVLEIFDKYNSSLDNYNNIRIVSAMVWIGRHCCRCSAAMPVRWCAPVVAVPRGGPPSADRAFFLPGREPSLLHGSPTAVRSAILRILVRKKKEKLFSYQFFFIDHFVYVFARF